MPTVEDWWWQAEAQLLHTPTVQEEQMKLPLTLSPMACVAPPLLDHVAGPPLQECLVALQEYSSGAPVH